MKVNFNSFLYFFNVAKRTLKITYMAPIITLLDRGGGKPGSNTRVKRWVWTCPLTPEPHQPSGVQETCAVSLSARSAPQGAQASFPPLPSLGAHQQMSSG